mmetsp:Transcript_22506/g.27750  ORF Transcript_22506/g.27750 Transcript_22506/m.27750 type:complete len:341 (-) Transcript_22506:332-1354(-)|eukprot:CAMPEP_0172514554 /NCGR_PEP_ID=MMETSP1066-20121228/260929_1 /TAXON_ID=671091 /ORGANISM="Coscinodiscus wailesii, Strain CCMP2513" /LENGTH=340 /DNA_ID=CAMNT_0013295257 /DNA_START=68 /DNA_END=1090 /DNA_ORIENTATION=+
MVEKYDKIEQIRREKVQRAIMGLLVVCITWVLCSVVSQIHTNNTQQERARVRSALVDILKKEKSLEKGDGVVGDHSRFTRKQNDPPPPQNRIEKSTIHDLETSVSESDKKVRDIKSHLPPGEFMETSPDALAATAQLQAHTRLLLRARYGPHEPYRVRVSLQFQPTISDYDVNGPDGSFVIEMAPAALVPHSVFTFLEVARLWKGGAFHRVAGHVLQVMVKNRGIDHLAFQEYSARYPHKKGTVGYAGRPSGPAWYVSIQDNSRNHGPGSQQQANPHEADSCFGTVVEGFQEVVLDRIRKMPGKEFINDPKKHVIIKKMTIMVPKEEGSTEFVEWQDPEA